MAIKILKLILCALVFYVGSLLGNTIASAAGFQAAALAPGEDAGLSLLYQLWTSPLMAFAIILIATGIKGSSFVRTITLSFMVWIAYSVTNELEGLVFANYATGFWHAAVQALVPSLLVAAIVVHLFPPDQRSEPQTNAWKSFFRSRKAGAWIWRLMVACLSFAPVYFVLGLLVMPFVGSYYEQNVGGLQQPEVGRLFSILALRSLLFCLACLPVLILWTKPLSSLLWRLGFGLSVWVGLLYLLSAYWLPVNLRLVHAVEILGDEFLYTSILIWLLRGVPQRSIINGKTEQTA